MSKRKTRQEKIIADLRRKLQTSHPVSSFDSSQKSQVITPSNTITYITPPQKKSFVVYDKTYVTADLRKTGILTFSTLAFEALLYFLLQRHIISLVSLRY